MTTVAASPRYTITEPMKEKVLPVLDGMASIARAEMMDRVGYLGDTVKPSRVGAACRGRKACAIGSLWLAAGVRFIRYSRMSVQLPGVSQGERWDFVRTRPVLRHSLHFLNEAAAEYIERHDIHANPHFDDPIESLFESEDRSLEGPARRRVMLKVIASAKRKVRAA